MIGYITRTFLTITPCTSELQLSANDRFVEVALVQDVNLFCTCLFTQGAQ
jgi:hypothetical protein